MHNLSALDFLPFRHPFRVSLSLPLSFPSMHNITTLTKIEIRDAAMQINAKTTP